MTHETAQQRRRRHKADRFRAAQLAPKMGMPPVVCGACGHARGLHCYPDREICLGLVPGGRDCTCTEYREAE